MYRICCLLILFLFMQILNVFAEENTSEKLAESTDTLVLEKPFATDSSLIIGQKASWTESKYFRQSIFPVTLATSSLAILAFPDLKYEIQEQLNWDKYDQVKLWDDELRYAPMGAVALLSLVGLKGEHTLLEQVAIGGVAYILADFIVYRTKLATQVARPAPFTERNSFPSQHASIAFVGATFLHREFGYISPWISVAGYTTATWVAYSRVARNRHFVPDVLMGAAVGTLATNATYWVYDALMPKLKNRLSLSPNLGPEGAEIQLSYNF